MKIVRERALFYVIGIVIMTLGIGVLIQSSMGTSPFDALLVGLYRTVGLTVGSWEIILGVAMVLINAMIKKRRPNYLAIGTSVITGICIDMWLLLLRGWLIPSFWVEQWLFMFLGIILSGIGVATYLQAKFAPIPMDEMMLVIREVTGKNLAHSRILINIVLVALALIFNGPIGIGTVIIALSSGYVINYLMPFAETFYKKTTIRTTSLQKNIS
ncbi:YitT family protein [Bacillaceae bacterium S4-13-58]